MPKKPFHIVVDGRNRRSSTGRYTDRLIQYLQALDTTNSYTILVQPDDQWEPVGPNFKTVPCRYKQFSFNPLEQISFALQLYLLKPDLVHFTMTQQPLLYFGRTVTTTHDLTMLRYTRKGRLPAWVHAVRMALYRFMFWWVHKKTQAILVPSKFVARDLAEYQPFTKQKTLVTYESSEPPLPGAAQPLKGVSEPFIMHVGSPFPHKNIDRLIEAFEVLAEKYPKLQLVLVGKKEFYFDRLMERIETSAVGDRIIVPGFIFDAELKWLYEHAAAYVLPSLSEGFGLPGLEAMVHGCPLVSSKATCLPEIYGVAAHYFNPFDSEDMAAKINEVITDKSLRDQLIAIGHEQAAKYSWRHLARQTLDVYRDVLND